MKYLPVSPWAVANFTKYVKEGFKVYKETDERVLFTNIEATHRAFASGNGNDDSFRFGFWIDKLEEGTGKIIKEKEMKKFYKKPEEKRKIGAIIGGIYKSKGVHNDPKSLFLLAKVDGGYTMITLQESEYSQYGAGNSSIMENASDLTMAYELVAENLVELIETHALI